MATNVRTLLTVEEERIKRTQLISELKATTFWLDREWIWSPMDSSPLSS